MSESEFLLLATPVLAVKGAICFRCLKVASRLDRCSRCKRVFYCSPKCQKEDWRKGHKQLCPVLVEINSIYRPCGPRTWSEYRIEMLAKQEAMKSLQPKLMSSDNRRIVYYQPYCANCYRNIFQLPEDSKLRLCPSCELVHHCTSCSASQHEVKCSSFKEIGRAEKFAIHHHQGTGEVSPQMATITPRKTYIPLSQVSSWYDYYTRISDHMMIAGAVSHDLKPLFDDAEMISSALIAATDKGTIILTILAALEVIYCDLAKMETINLHIIGATARELSVLALFEELLHLLPSLRELHCSFIGIELPRLESSKSIVFDCCETCTAAKRTRSLEMWKGVYHDYIKTDKYVKPDLAVAFHTGHTMEAIEEWAPTIKHLVDAEHCTLFTTFNEDELLDEMEALRKLEARVVRKDENKWRGLKPMLEIMEEVENSVYYFNMYWYIVAGRGWSDRS